MAKELHLSSGDLIAFSDGELEHDRAAVISSHLDKCADCRRRWEDLRRASGDYSRFHHQVLKPSLGIPDGAWPELALKTASRSWTRPIGVWAAAAVAAACLVLRILYVPAAAERRDMNRLLARAADAPAPHRRRIRLSEGGRSWLRPAMLPSGSGAAEMEQVGALFVQANYSWEDPLSARSFASWRNHLREKRDHLTAIRNGDGPERFYRLQTETRDGSLHSASLTLRKDDLIVVAGAFEFEHREQVTMVDDGPDAARSSASPLRADTPGVKNEQVETQVSPADELHVFEALNEIGADVDEPLTVEPDATKRNVVVVTGVGLSSARQKEIVTALAAVPNTSVRFSSARPPTTLGASSADFNEPKIQSSETLRQLVEKRAGGVKQMQSVSEQASEAADMLLARSHALLMLAQAFPSDAERRLTLPDQLLLRKLRRRHAVATEETTLRLAQALKPLFADFSLGAGRSDETYTGANTSWQSGAAILFESVRKLDLSVTRLLNANYSDAEGAEVLNRLPGHVEHTEALAREQVQAE